MINTIGDAIMKRPRYVSINESLNKLLLTILTASQKNKGMQPQLMDGDYMISFQALAIVSILKRWDIFRA